MIQSIETGRKEDGNRSIADKIIKRLHDLEKTVLNNHGRWTWELLQNAKDSVADSNRPVAVRLIYSKNQIEFQHNSDHFTEKDIRGLINQISSKEVEENEQSTRTGRFGTGFLTTHLLSKLIHIKGIVKTQDNRFFQFNFPLDRDGKLRVRSFRKSNMPGQHSMPLQKTARLAVMIQRRLTLPLFTPSMMTYSEISQRRV